MGLTPAPCRLALFLGLFQLLAACSSPDGTAPENGDGGTTDDGAVIGGGGDDGGGGGGSCTPEGSFTGAPVTGSPGQWQWIGVPEAKCRNGSTTGFGVRLNPSSNKLVIYFEGGGACFNGISCSANPDHFAAADFTTWQTSDGTSGIFETNNAANPLRDWNAVYVPYCTGDVHAGVATGVTVPGLGSPTNQSFVGISA